MVDAYELIRYGDKSSFLGSALPFLEIDEAVNGLMIGLASGPTPALFMAEVTHGGKTVAAAFLRDRNLILTHTPEAALRLVAEELLESGVDVPGAVGPLTTADAFAALWAELRGCVPQIAMNARIYKLTEVIVPTSVPGAKRMAALQDVDLLLDWMTGFHYEAVPREPFTAEGMRTSIENKIALEYFFLWEFEGRPVSVAALARPTAHTFTINSVYTPPEFRGQGFASALVAQLSQAVLDGGKDCCVLYTDLANPTSNSIYQRIGYRPLCDSHHYVFRYP
jgi:hypothetical protein